LVRSPTRSLTSLFGLRESLTDIVRAALDASDAGGLVRRALASADVAAALAAASSIRIVGAGKAAPAMMEAALAMLDGLPVAAALGISTSAGRPGSRGRWMTAPHPVPDAASVAAARAVFDLAASTGPDDLFLLLLSGGASAMVAQPADGITLEDKRTTSSQLLREGAEVHLLNAVRKHLSAIKGGQLATAVAGRVLTLAVSDVVGDDLSAIGSGPTVADETTFGDALAVLDEYGSRSRYPAAVVARLEAGAAGRLLETPKPGDARLARTTARVIGGARTAVQGARAAAEARGYDVHTIAEPLVGDARVAARTLVDAAVRLLPEHPGPFCLLAAGELTVRVTGTGKGGRNQECTLALAGDIGRITRPVVAASVGTDGVDGPTDAAGALCDTTTLSRADAAGLASFRRYLDNNNSYEFFNTLNDLIRTGPTSTNVGDLQILLIAPDAL
jgi:glycerate-2-kinase